MVVTVVSVVVGVVVVVVVVSVATLNGGGLLSAIAGGVRPLLLPSGNSVTGAVE